MTKQTFSTTCFFGIYSLKKKKKSLKKVYELYNRMENTFDRDSVILSWLKKGCEVCRVLCEQCTSPVPPWPNAWLSSLTCLLCYCRSHKSVRYCMMQQRPASKRPTPDPWPQCPPVPFPPLRYLHSCHGAWVGWLVGWFGLHGVCSAVLLTSLTRVQKT